jgi:hypothetical protein
MSGAGAVLVLLLESVDVVLEVEDELAALLSFDALVVVAPVEEDLLKLQPRAKTASVATTIAVVIQLIFFISESPALIG